MLLDVIFYVALIVVIIFGILRRAKKPTGKP
jgi:hypothetical protein